MTLASFQQHLESNDKPRGINFKSKSPFPSFLDGAVAEEKTSQSIDQKVRKPSVGLSWTYEMPVSRQLEVKA